MKLCVFSDSHGYTRKMLQAIRHEQPDMLVFLGDGSRDFDAVRSAFPHLPALDVRGNCDTISDSPLFLVFTVQGVKIFMTHGHRYGVKYDPDFDELCSAAKKAEAGIALFGHTHQAYCRIRDEVLLLNPGSVGERGKTSYAVIQIQNYGKFKADIKGII